MQIGKPDHTTDDKKKNGIKHEIVSFVKSVFGLNDSVHVPDPQEIHKIVNKELEKQYELEQKRRKENEEDKTFIKYFEGAKTIYPIYSRSSRLTTYPKSEDINKSNNNDQSTRKQDIQFAKSSDYVSTQLNQFLVTDPSILKQFPDSQNRKILASETLYDALDLWRFADAYRSDGQVRNVITTMIKYVLGNGRPKIVIDVNDYFSSTDEEQTALEQVLANPEYKEIARQISKENRRIGFHEKIIGCLIDNAIYGRAALRKVYYDPAKDTIPASILKKLGLKDQFQQKQGDNDARTINGQKLTNNRGLEILRNRKEEEDEDEEKRRQLRPKSQDREQGDNKDPDARPEPKESDKELEDTIELQQPKKIIKGLIKLNPIRMGKVYYYEDNDELAGVEYLDYDIGRNIVLAEDMIYFSGDNMDTEILPRIKYQGLSVIESMIDISETTILNNQTNIKEINRSLWAAFLVLKFLTKEPDNLDEFIANYEAGKPIATNADLETQVTTVGHDLDKILEQRNNSDMKINRDGQVPDFLAGFPNVNNFATASIEYNAWINSIVRDKRTMLRNVIEPQWIDPLIIELKGLKTREELIDLDFKVKLDFENINIIDPISVNTNPIIQLRNQGFIDEETGLELLGLKYLIPKLQKIREERERKEQEMIDAMKQAGGYGLNKNPGMSIRDKDEFNIKKSKSEPSTPDPNAGQDLSAQKGGNRAPIGRGKTPRA